MAHMTQAPSPTAPEITLGWRLRMALEHAGLKSEEMADLLGVHRGTIARWTHDVGKPPRPIYLQRWAEVCQVPYGWLSGAADTQEAPGGVTPRSAAHALAA